MMKLLNIASLLILITAGVLFVSCGIQWTKGLPGSKTIPDKLSIVEKYRTLESSSQEKRQNIVSPLVQQASLFASYLNPPVPKKPVTNSPPKVNTAPVRQVQNVTPKFRLLATTFYRSSPDKSLALVSEPGKGDHWIGKGERLGHFVVERIEEGTLIYRNGNQSHQMKITMPEMAQMARLKTGISVSSSN